MKRYLIPFIMLAVVSCSTLPLQNLPAQDSLEIVVLPSRNAGKSNLPLDMEDKITSAVIAVYGKGKLVRTEYVTEGFGQIPFKLESDVAASVYALVNMGDVRNSIPEFEADMPSFSYHAVSYDQVEDWGFPMSGHGIFNPSSSGAKQISVEMLFAKIHLNLRCDWPGGNIEYVEVYNVNMLLKPFGASFAVKPADLLNGIEYDESAVAGPSASYILYVPENLQGDIDGIESPQQKSEDFNEELASKSDYLTYIETFVTGDDLYEGEIIYRSYLGNNATNNFDIERNTEYFWTITFTEDNCTKEEWKYNSFLDDLREFSVESPVYITAGEDICIWQYTDTNMDGSMFNWSYDDPSMAVTGKIGDNLEDDILATDEFADIGSTIDLEIEPMHNVRESLCADTRVIIVEDDIAWRRTLNGKYYLNPGTYVDGYVDYGVDRGQGRSSIPSLYWKRWNLVSGIPYSLRGPDENNWETVRFSTARTTTPGSEFNVTARTKSGMSATASVIINETRLLEWKNRASNVSSAAVLKYVFMNNREIHVFMLLGNSYTLAESSVFSLSNTPFRLRASDINGINSFGGYSLRSAADRYLGTVYSPADNFGPGALLCSSSTENDVSVIPGIEKSLSTGDYTMKVVPVFGNPDSREALTITATIHVVPRSGNHYVRVLELVPSGTITQAVGERQSFTARLHTYRFYNGNFMSDAVSYPTSITWTGAPGGVFTATTPGVYLVKGTYISGSINTSATALVSVTSPVAGISGGWEDSGTIILE